MRTHLSHHPRFSLDENIWTTETILFTGSEFAEALFDRVKMAQTSIRIESYIFERDQAGESLLAELKIAARRGVKVRVIVDAIGSPDWDSELLRDLERDGVRAQIFGTPRSLINGFLRLLVRGRWITAYRVIRKIQLRNHRKLSIFDEQEAIVGSANVGERFREWRETSVILRGPGVARLRESFVRSWHFARGDRATLPALEKSSKIRTNFLRRERKTTNRRYLADLASAQTRIWLTTAYFNPGPRRLHSLFSALRRGVDLRIVVPGRSDIRFFPWLSRAVLIGLIERGARVYEFAGPMQHAKTTLFDSRAIVGSTNLNNRSFIHDLELDIMLESTNAVETLEKLFLADCARSVELTAETIRGYAPIAYALSFLLMPFKRWL